MFNQLKSLLKLHKSGSREAPELKILRELNAETTFSMRHLKARLDYHERRGLTPEQAKLVILIEHHLKVGFGISDEDSAIMW